MNNAGDKIIIGGPEADGGIGVVRVFVYDRPGDSRSQLGPDITGDGTTPSVSVFFGYSVDIDEFEEFVVAIIGAPQSDFFNVTGPKGNGYAVFGYYESTTDTWEPFGFVYRYDYGTGAY